MNSSLFLVLDSVATTSAVEGKPEVLAFGDFSRHQRGSSTLPSDTAAFQFNTLAPDF